MANMFVDKRKKYGNEPRGAANPIRQCVDEYQFSPTSQGDFFPSLIPNRKRGEGSSIICQVSKISSPPNTPWDPTMSFVLLPNSNSVAVFLIPCQKNGSGTFAQICKLEPEEQMLPRFVGGNSCKTSLDSRFDRFQFSQNALFQLSWDRRHLRNSCAHPLFWPAVKNNSITRKCSQFRVNLLISFYLETNATHKIIVIPLPN